ncbi:hypothetical protein ACFRCI_45295 [Streptomyces sp. NPDC056638]|uniref:hypothetical protein n=1 Tax=Streptomyces sp. NPDC056638 TaxID=3345887 RepID=UPI0036C3C464
MGPRQAQPGQPGLPAAQRAWQRERHIASEGIWAFPPADPPSGGRVSDPPVYGRGAMVVHKVHKVRRAVGDETFFDILRTWTRQHRHGNADTRQFIALCGSKSGKDLAALFDTWLFDKKKPSRI